MKTIKIIALYIFINIWWNVVFYIGFATGNNSIYFTNWCEANRVIFGILFVGGSFISLFASESYSKTLKN